VCGRGAKSVSFAHVSPEAFLTFAGERADLARQLSNRLAPLLVTDQLQEVYRELEMPLIPVLADVERAGIRIDGPALAAQSQHIEQALDQHTARIWELAGEQFNVNSPKQLGEILFEKLKLPALKKTGKTRSVSTAADVPEDLALSHDGSPGARVARLAPLESTHIDALPLLVHRNRPGSHLLQPGDCRDGPLEQLRSESAEHPDPDRAGTRDPPRLHRRTRQRPDLR
jgi:DNA polymerase-1